MFKVKEANVMQQILYSCYDHISRDGENFVPEHVLSYIIEGSQVIYSGGSVYEFKDGDFRFFRKNQLSKFVKQPSPCGVFKSVSIRLDQDTLRGMATENNLYTTGHYTGESVLLLKPDDLLNNYIASLTPYINGTSAFNKAVTTLKVKEAIMILLETNPALKNVLFDFSSPGKIDIEGFMNENYKFNADINRFAYLTGRSLATFKRDFMKVFNTSPNRWLQQKRLNDAYFLIKEKGWKSSEVYMEVGFKDFSHFSFAFKKAFGIPPSRIV